MAGSNAGWNTPPPPKQGRRTPSWAIAQALLLYHRGLSLRKVAEDLAARQVPRSHVAIWKWIQQSLESVPVWDTQHPLPGEVLSDQGQEWGVGLTGLPSI